MKTEVYVLINDTGTMVNVRVFASSEKAIGEAKQIVDDIDASAFDIVEEVDYFANSYLNHTITVERREIE